MEGRAQMHKQIECELEPTSRSTVLIRNQHVVAIEPLAEFQPCSTGGSAALSTVVRLVTQ
jgi:hypothetical protein